MKFIFPRDKLSVQVHPDDETARRAGLPNGKTECWYVMQAEPGAKVGLGLKPGATREQFAQAIREVRAEELLNWTEVRAGEMIYVDAGTVHAIGPGVILLETQQNSDTTYRLYDYGRPRELHVKQGLEALKERTKAGTVPAGRPEDGGWMTLVNSPCFAVRKIAIREGKRITNRREGHRNDLPPKCWSHWTDAASWNAREHNRSRWRAGRRWLCRPISASMRFGGNGILTCCMREFRTE